MEDDFELFSSLRYDPALLQVPASNLSHAGWNWNNASPFYMLDYHRDRMLSAAIHWGWDAAVEVLKGDAGLKRLRDFIMSNIGDDQPTPMRVRVAITREGELSVTSGPVPETPLANLFPEQLPPPGEPHSDGLSGHIPTTTTEYQILVDGHGAAWTTHSHFKTTKRAVYDVARQRAPISLHDKKEVLIINEADGTVMEGSTTTPYFWREGRWVTPAVSMKQGPEKGIGGQNGTSRRWALERCVISSFSSQVWGPLLTERRGLAVEDTVLASSLSDAEECWLSNGVRGFIFGRVRLG
jgi:hypothetical protein